MYKLPIINIEKTGQNIMNLRKQKGFSVKDLHDIFGFTTPNAIYAKTDVQQQITFIQLHKSSNTVTTTFVLFLSNNNNTTWINRNQSNVECYRSCLQHTTTTMYGQS